MGYFELKYVDDEGNQLFVNTIDNDHVDTIAPGGVGAELGLQLKNMMRNESMKEDSEVDVSDFFSEDFKEAV